MKWFAMSGWKTWTAGLGSIIIGIGTVITALTGDVPPGDRINTGLTEIIGGLAIIGLGHKIEKGPKGGK